MGDSSVNPPDMIQRLAGAMRERGVTPEVECFDQGMTSYAKHLIGAGVLQPPFHFNVFVGNPCGLTASTSSVTAACSCSDAP